MKKITLLIFLLTVSLGYSQVVLEDFDGTPPSFTPNNGLGSTAIVADPDDASNMVGQLISAAAGDPWQQADLLMQNNMMDLTSNTTVQVDIYSNTAINVLSRIEDPILTVAPFATADASHTGSGWETLTFDFTQLPDGGTAANNEFSQISFFPGWVGGGAGNNGVNPNWNDPVDGIILLVDNITAVAGTSLPIETCNDGILNNGETEIDCGGPNCDACPTPPSGPPSVPPARDPMDVISVFSDAYTDEATEQRQAFGDAVVTELDYSGNMIISATTPLPGAGFQYQYFGSNLDLSGMTHMHIDFYFEGSPTTAGTFFTVIAQYNGGSNAVQNNIDVTSLASNTWHEIDVTFDSFASGQPRDQIQQVIVQINGPDIYGPFYVDNIYFHNNMVLGTEEFETAEFNVFPNPTKNDWKLSSTNTINNVSVYDILGKQVLSFSPNANEATIDGSSLRTGVYFARIEGINGSKTIKLVRE